MDGKSTVHTSKWTLIVQTGAFSWYFSNQSKIQHSLNVHQLDVRVTVFCFLIQNQVHKLWWGRTLN